MKRLYLIIIVIALYFISGCAQIDLNRTEIDKIFALRIIAIDRIDANKLKMTITSKSVNSAPKGEGSNSNKSKVIVSEGETVFDAARNLLTYANEKPRYGHTEFILFGEDTARDGIFPLIYPSSIYVRTSLTQLIQQIKVKII